MGIQLNNVSLDIKKSNFGLGNEKVARDFIASNLSQVRDKVSAFIADLGGSMDMYGSSQTDSTILMNLQERDIIVANRNIVNDEIIKENESCLNVFLSAISFRDEIACIPLPYNIENSEKPIQEMSDIELRVLEFQIKTQSSASLEKQKITPRVQQMVWDRRKQLVEESKQKSALATERASQPQLKISSLTEEQTIGATKLQSFVRQRKAKDKETVLKRTLLPPALMEEAKPYCNLGSWSEEDRAKNGKSRVYLSKESPYVYKWIQADQAQSRLGKMEQAHEICEKSGYKDLIIPQARGYGEFLVERKLPFEQSSYESRYDQIRLYVKNAEKFDNAVTEFMGFLGQSYLSDIIDERGLGRYDNVPLYLEDGQGKIGLIDLERFYPDVGEVEDWLFLRCKDAIRLFPYHFDKIMEVAKKIDPTIEEARDLLIVERDKQLEVFTAICKS